MKHKGTVTIETERLILRPFCREDAPAMFRNFEGDPRVTKFLTWQPAKTLADAEQVLGMWLDSYADPAFYQWAIVPRELGEPVGTISVVQMNEKIDLVHIGYCIGHAWWHQGITSEAFGAIIPFFFREVGVNRIESRHDVNNPNSGKVMKKCGLQYEGTLRQADWSNQGIVDASYYGLLRQDWERSLI